MSPSFKFASVLLSVAIVTACGGGGGGGGSDDGGDGGSEVTVADLGISAASDADAGSSYSHTTPDILIDYYQVPVEELEGEYPLRDAWGYLDIDGDGDTDVFLGTGAPGITGEVPSQIFINDGAGGLAFDNSFFNGNPPPATHARKTLVADFNNDSLLDMLVLDHGYDAEPFPGSVPKLVMQDSTGSFSWQKLTAQTGFHHTGTAADIDNDGDIDVFVGGFEPFFFINDGSGTFRKVDDRYDGVHTQVFTSELIDVDKDGFVDLLLGGNEQDNQNTIILWGSSTGSYSAGAMAILPAVTRYGTVLDFDAADLNGDGVREVVINRTGGGDGNYYVGFYLQILEGTKSGGYTDISAASLEDPANSSFYGWVRWVRAQDIDGDGDIDLFSDNAGDEVYEDTDAGFVPVADLLFLNDGEGNFERSQFEDALLIDI